MREKTTDAAIAVLRELVAEGFIFEAGFLRARECGSSHGRQSIQKELTQEQASILDQGLGKDSFEKEGVLVYSYETLRAESNTCVCVAERGSGWINLCVSWSWWVDLGLKRDYGFEKDSRT